MASAIGTYQWLLSPILAAFSNTLANDIAKDYEPKTTDSGTKEDAIKARSQLLILLGGLGATIAAPAVYLYTRKGRKKRKLTEKEHMMGKTLENASAQATGLLMTALAAPAISAAAAYILVQKLEDGKIITKGLGDGAQALLTVAASGPAIQGIGGMVSSAFKAGK